jgi:hypothetical protein
MMANHPNPDTVPSMMQHDFGTKVLITSPQADKYLMMARKKKYGCPPEDRYSRWCGGKNGFDDFSERLH